MEQVLKTRSVTESHRRAAREPSSRYRDRDAAPTGSEFLGPDPARTGSWPTGDVCGLCEAEVVLVEDAGALYVECTCGPVIVLT